MDLSVCRSRSFWFCAFLFCVCASAALARTHHIGGGQTYTSPGHAFQLMAPASNNFANLDYTVREETKKDQYEFAAFAIQDFGELYKAGVFQSGDVASTADRMAVSTDFQKKTAPEIAGETKVSTQFGEGLLRLYRLKGGALIAPVTVGNITMTPAGHPRSKTPSDSYVAVLVVQQGARVIFATAEDDNFGLVEGHQGEEWRYHVQDIAQKLLASMKLEK